MLLHRYFNSHAWDTLERAKLKAARISSFNDSFEFLYFTVGKKLTPDEALKSLPSLLSNAVFRQGLIDAIQREQTPLNLEEAENILKANPELASQLVAKIWPQIVQTTELPITKRRQIIDERMRAICFSDQRNVKTSDEILLWSHYGKKHEGVRIGFEFPTGFMVPFQIAKIKYEDRRVEVVFSIGDDSTTFKSILRSATVKCKVWEYEQEYRLLAETNLCFPETIKSCDSRTTVEYFLDFKREWVKAVDFGVFCPESEIQRVVALLKADYPHVIAKKAQFHKTDYAFEYEQIFP
jgi:DUF2971 family protein